MVEMNLKRGLVEVFIKIKYGFQLNKPVFILRVFKKYFDVKLLGKKPFKYVDVAFDYTCNLRCQHCFARDFEDSAKKRKMKKMSIEDHKRFAEQAMKLGATSFCFQGGEPLLPPLKNELEEIIKAYNPYKNLITITTNGTYIDEKTAQRLKKIGVDIFTFSLDSGVPEEHDTFRGGKGTFNKAMKAIEIATNNGLKVAINTAITHQSLYSEGFKKLIDFSEKHKIFLNPIFAVPVGAWQGNWNVVLTKDDIKYVEELRNKHPFLRRDVDSNFVEWGCGAVNETVYLTAYGDVLPCPFIHVSLGNVLEEPLDTIRKRGLKIKLFDHYNKKCYTGEDIEFMKEYAKRIKDKKEFPLKVSDMKGWWN